MEEDHLVKVKLTLGWGRAVWKPTLYPREKLVTLEAEPFIFKVLPCDLGC